MKVPTWMMVWAGVVGLGTLGMTAPARAETPAASAATSDDAEQAQPGSLEGVWSMSLTLRDCTTNAALGPPFRSLLTFHQGGTVSESPGTTQFAPGQRTPGQGVWARTGDTTFRNRLVAMILFDTPPSPPTSPGFLAGWQLIDSTATMSGADTLSVSATTEFYDLTRQRYRAACVSGSAERFK